MRWQENDVRWHAPVATLSKRPDKHGESSVEALKRPIILLDLNYTLVANSEVKVQPIVRQIEQEIYRSELIDAVRDLAVILITARPASHRTATLDSV